MSGHPSGPDLALIQAMLSRKQGNGKDQDPRLTLRYGWDAVKPVPMGTIVTGLLHGGSLTLFYGPPKSGKSFLVTDMFLAIAAAQSHWMGHSIVRSGPVLYVACEGHTGFWKRLKAKALSEAWDRESFPSNFVLATGRPILIAFDLDTRAFVPHPDAVLNAIADVSKQIGQPIAVAVDTVFRSFGAGNVNASDHMNSYLAALASITDQGIALAAVHHETKSSNSPAGSVTLMGGADTIVHTANGDADHSWEVEYAKDDATTERHSFSLPVIEIGTDLEGQLASSCVVQPADTDQPPVTNADGRLPVDAKIGLRSLRDAIDKHGAYLTGMQFPPDTFAVAIDVWRQEFYSLKGGEPATNRKGFNRAQDHLLARFVITQSDGFVWLVKRDKQA